MQKLKNKELLEKRQQGHFLTGPEEANCHVMEMVMWQKMVGGLWLLKTLILQPQGIKFFQQPVSLEEDPKPQIKL